MQFPLDFWNVSLWLAVTAIVLLITAQLISAYDGPASLRIEKKRLRNAALTIGILFLVTVAIRISNIITSPWHPIALFYPRWLNVFGVQVTQANVRFWIIAVPVFIAFVATIFLQLTHDPVRPQ